MNIKDITFAVLFSFVFKFNSYPILGGIISLEIWEPHEYCLTRLWIILHV